MKYQFLFVEIAFKLDVIYKNLWFNDEISQLCILHNIINWCKCYRM